MVEEMNKNKILFILIQIDEAHSKEWSIGRDYEPESQKDIHDRINRANEFVKNESVPIPVYVDTWTNDFAETYHAWPDRYYCTDSNNTIIAMSEYGSEGNDDAKIKKDCLILINELIENM